MKAEDLKPFYGGAGGTRTSVKLIAMPDFEQVHRLERSYLQVFEALLLLVTCRATLNPIDTVRCGLRIGPPTSLRIAIFFRGEGRQSLKDKFQVARFRVDGDDGREKRFRTSRPVLHCSVAREAQDRYIDLEF